MTLPPERALTQHSRWHWPLIDQPVDTRSLVMQEWKHAGDSPIIAARPRKRPGQPTPPSAYLLKVGRDALGERLYALAARHFHLPSAVIWWTTSADLPEVAIRFEPAAWRPQRIDPVVGLATLEGREARLCNPLDYYRHLALSDLLGEDDGVEFMVCEDVLFRIDAAGTGWTLFSFLLQQFLQPEGGTGTAYPLDLSPLAQATLDGLRQEASGYQVYREMLAEIVAWTELPGFLADDLRTCPAARCQFIPAVVGAAFHREIPPLSGLADAVEVYLRHQQDAIKGLLL